MELDLAELTRVIGQHPAVAEVVCEPGSNGRPLVHLTVRPGYPDEAQRLAWHEKRVARWQLIWERTYSDLKAGEDASFNTTSWVDSYTRKPLTDAEMHEMQNAALARADVREGARVFEIGCGSGLILLSLAPRCAQYVATDISAGSVRYNQQQAAERGLAQVQVRQQPAHDFSGCEPGTFDRVLFNSVVQYFPGGDYLERVLRGAVALLAPGGAIFLGDIRNLQLQRALQDSIHRAHFPGLSDDERDKKVDAQIAQEGELLVHPWFFADVARRLEGVGDVEVQLKRGEQHNELTRYRYDVVLRKRPPAPPVAVGEHAWSTVGSREGLRRLASEARAPLWVRDVPNARLSASADAVDPESLWRELSALGLDADITWAASQKLDRVDVLLRPAGQPRPAPVVPASLPARLANDPLRGTWQRHLTQALDGAISAALGRAVPVNYAFVEKNP